MMVLSDMYAVAVFIASDLTGPHEMGKKRVLMDTAVYQSDKLVLLDSVVHGRIL